MQTDILVAILISFFTSVLLTPIVIPFLQKFKMAQQVREEGPRSHFRKSGTPTMGGLIILGAVVVTSLVFVREYTEIILGLVVPIIMALLLNEVRNAGLKKGIQTLVYLPHFLSWVTVAGMLRDILGLDGIVNSFLKLFGVEPIFFLGEAGMFRQIVVISDLWKGFGFGMIVYLAAISNIDQSLYEAAEMDGANRWQQTLHITLPGIMPMIIVMATLSLGNVLNAGFDQIFNLYSPLTYSTGDIIDTYVYRQSLVNGQYSFGTAVGLFKSGIGLALTAISYKIAYNVAGYRIF